MAADKIGNAPDGASLITLLGVGKCFGAQRVLTNVHLQIGAGDAVKLGGESGAGKTTLLRICMGLETPSEGQVIRRDNLRFSAVFQEDRLVLPLSAAKNLALVTRDAQSAAKLLEQLGVSYADTKPVRELSGGMRRRVALARALLAESDVLVLDEPFTGLDEENIDRAKAAVKAHLCGRALLLASHLDDGEWMPFRHIKV